MATATFTLAAQVDMAVIRGSSDVSYAAAHDAAEGTVFFYQSHSVGQILSASVYYVYRIAIGWDTSGLDDSALIKSAYLTLNLAGLNNNTTILIKDGRPTYPQIPTPIAGDYDITHYSSNGGMRDLTGLGIYDSFNLEISSTGLTWINKSGYTKFIIISQEDNNSTSPTGDESSQIYDYHADINYRPKLVVEYYLPSGSPVVTSVGPCTDRQSTTMSAVGNVTDDGGGYEERGFEYYEDTAGYASEMYAVRELGVFSGTGNFEMTIYGLKPVTTYQIRAWVRNSFGISYGEWYTCITTEVPSYGIYTATNTAKYRLYVSDDEAIAWRGYKGPYSGKMTLINITDITNKTKGVKVLKLLPDSKGTFHVCVTLKEEIKS